MALGNPWCSGSRSCGPFGQLVENKDPQGSIRPPVLINTYGAGKSVLARAVAPADVPMATVCFGGHMDPRRLLLLESTRRPADDPCTWLQAVEA